MAWLLALPVAGAACGSLSAQILVPVVPAVPVGRTVIVTRGVGLDYHRRRVRLAGVYENTYVVEGYGPYAPPPQVTVNYYAPRTVVVNPPRDEDLSGVDLDKGPPPWAAPPVRKADLPEPVPGKAPPRAEAPEKKPVAPLPQPPPPLKDPSLEATAQTTLGVQAFTEGDYGLAARHFRQAAGLDRENAKARFYLAQAYFALGRYREAVVAIHEGMDIDPNWPKSAFRPRLELFKGHEAELTAQLKDLDNALARSPDNRTFLFLDAYQLWFDGRRKEAVALFRRAREVTVDPAVIDRFLRAAADEVVAR
jgi:hypothetical protein